MSCDKNNLFISNHTCCLQKINRRRHNALLIRNRVAVESVAIAFYLHQRHDTRTENGLWL